MNTGFYSPCVAAVPDSSIEDEEHLLDHLGDARYTTFSKAWNSLQNLRRKHLLGLWNSENACKDCNVWSAWPNIWTKKNKQYFVEGRNESIFKP